MFTLWNKELDMEVVIYNVRFDDRTRETFFLVYMGDYRWSSTKEWKWLPSYGFCPVSEIESR